MKTILLLIFFVFESVHAAESNTSLTDAQLLQIKFEQKLNSQVSRDLVFRDENGKEVTLGSYLGKRPVVLILGYYTCPMLCTLTLNGAMESFRDLKWSVGKQFEVVFVSINPGEGPALAAEKKELYLRDYGRTDAQASWHFLTDVSQSGPDPAVRALADEIGFNFAYDAALKQYAHPSGFVVLTPDGRVAHYFFGVTFSPNEVDAALREAADKKIGSPVEEFVLLCCQYSPLRGKYGNLVMAAVRVGGLATLVGLGVLLIRPARQNTKAAK